MICAKNKPAVSGLEQEFPGRVEARNIESTSEEGVRAVREFGFESHGLVIRSVDGRVLWKQPDHRVNLDDVRTALKQILQNGAAAGNS